jgi:phenylacetate-CoA ligase
VRDDERGSAWELQSALPGVLWPAVPAPGNAAVLALLYQFERSQWLPAERLFELQLRQLGLLLHHAQGTVPFYRERWSGLYDAAQPLTRERFAALPILSRRDLQENFESLRSLSPLAAHGPVGETRTSGSTGAPVRLLKNQLSGLLWNAFTLRDHAWHRRDLGRKLAVLRQGASAGESDTWGSATDGLAATGPCVTWPPSASVEDQLQWLERQQPAYLLTYPSLVAELARASLERGLRLPGLLEVRTLGEQFDPGIRTLCREAWNVPVVDVYSAEEVGYIALQCPRHEHYHVQSEGVLVEVLDDAGEPCAPGQVGRVVVTSLHNFAMPLVRYDIGDYAEAGAPCACGRGLPVLARVMGRVRNTLVTADGKRYWPSFGARTFPDIAPVLQHQFVQKAYDLIEVRLVTTGPLAPAQEEALRRHITARIPPGLRLSFSYCERIARGAGGKYEDFYSEISAAAR